MRLTQVSKYFLLFAFLTSKLCSAPDLTIVGFLEPEGGWGKIPISILECLQDDVSANFFSTDTTSSSRTDVPKYTLKALRNPDKTVGKVALLTTLIWSAGGANKMPKSMIKLAYSMLETTKIPSKWVELLNANFDGVVVPDEYLVTVFETSGVTIPIYVLPIPMVLEPYKKTPIHSIHPSKPFTFIDASATKNPGILIEAFAHMFGNNPDVHLLMRAGHINSHAAEVIKKAMDKVGPMTNITFEEGKISLPEFIQRLSSSDCFINLSRGEGFSFIPREALALGLPVIITDNTASKTICKSGFVRAVPSDKLGPSSWLYKFMFTETCGQQFDCEIQDVEAAMLDVYNNYATYIEKARQGREWVDQYDCANSKLRKMYQTLIKPTNVVLGDENRIEEGTIFTNSANLYRKYKSVIQRNKKQQP